MKKLIKSDICGSVNSAQMHCSRLKKSAFTVESKKKKKKKAETRFTPRRRRKMREPNIAKYNIMTKLVQNSTIVQWTQGWARAMCTLIVLKQKVEGDRPT